MFVLFVCLSITAIFIFCNDTATTRIYPYCHTLPLLDALPVSVLAGPILWDATDAGEVLRFYRDFVRDAPDELGTVVRFGAAPPLPVIPEDLHWRPVVMVGACYAGPVEDGEQEIGSASCRERVCQYV